MKCELIRTQVWFWCPGCKMPHAITLPNWTWNGDTEKPTFSPSLLCDWGDKSKVCHIFVTDGKIQYLSDCHHELKNTTVDMEEWTWPS